MYYAAMLMRDYNQEKLNKIHAAINRPTPHRDAKARELIKKLEQERLEKGIPHKRPPVLISRKMVNLPK